MTVDTRKLALLDQQLALTAYVDALLHDDAEAAPESTPAAGEPAAAPASAVPAPVAPAPEPVSEAAAGAVPVPDWAQTRFQALLFQVLGLTLAVPLIKLKGVAPHSGDITPMPGHSPLFIGLMPYQGLQSRVVDTARLVLPSARVAGLDADVSARSGHLVMIDDGRWALAASAIGEVIELRAADVKWRSSAGKRPWLAGTVIEKMCALLDTDALARLLEEGVAR